jgi:outer membrane protein OmpA-like peptidoglycan-associated protein
VLQGNPALKATLVGRADSVGSDANNMRLAQRRSAAVRDALVATGMVEAARIEMKWSGERQQNVATGDAVGDGRNRSVDIAVY